MKKICTVYLKPYTGKICLELAIKLFSTCGELALPMILSFVIDHVIPEKDAGKIAFWGIMMLACSVFSCVTHILTNRMSAYISLEAAQKFRDDLFLKISTLSQRQTETIGIPSLIARTTTDTYVVSDTLAYMQRTGVRAPIVLAGAAAFMLAMDPLLTMAVFLVTPAAALITWKAARRCLPLYMELQIKNDKAFGKARETLLGLRTVKAFSQESFESSRFQEKNQAMADQEEKAGLAMAAVPPLLNVSFQLCIVLVLIVAGFRVYGGFLLPGKVVAFLAYVSLILTALTNVSKILVLFSKSSASAGRIAEVLGLEKDNPAQEKPPSEKKVPQEQGSPDKKAVGKEAFPPKKSIPFLEFDHVSFSYHGRPETLTGGGDAVHEISFSLYEGERLGLIGGTGSGKSTLLALMLRYILPTKGAIRIWGEDIRFLSEEEVRAHFWPVFQNDYLCSGTFLDNIRFGRNISLQSTKQAAKTAQALDFIQEKEDGFEGRVEASGKNLSGGQKQRLLIARALAGEKRALILDDAFSGLDYKTEQLIRQALWGEREKQTAVIVSQRAGTLAKADRILVLEAGRAVGYGSHGQLLDTCQVYNEYACGELNSGIPK